MRVAVMLMLLGVTVGAGCTAPRRRPPEPWRGSEAALREARRSIVPLRTLFGFGTAIVVGEDLLLTCRHTAPDLALLPEARTPGFRSDVLVDGRPAQVKLLGAGPTERGEDEWALLQITGGACLDRPPARLAHDRDLRVGEPALVVGYWGGPAGTEASCRLWTLRTRIRESPPFFAPEVFALEQGFGRRYGGMSGGAVLVWDEPSQQYVVVGIYYGWQSLKRGFRIIDDVSTARTLPHIAPILCPSHSRNSCS